MLFVFDKEFIPSPLSAVQNFGCKFHEHLIWNRQRVRVACTATRRTGHTPANHAALRTTRAAHEPHPEELNARHLIRANSARVRHQTRV